jgi:hypothetical protein
MTGSCSAFKGFFVLICLFPCICVADKGELYEQAEIEQEVAQLKNLAVECKFQHEQVFFYSEYEITKPMGDIFEARDKNGRQIFGKVNSTTGNLENRSTNQCSIMFYKGRSVYEQIGFTGTNRICYIYNKETDKGVDRQWVGWDTDKPEVFPVTTISEPYGYIPYSGWKYLEGSVSTFKAENNVLLEETDDQFLLGPKDNKTMRFTFKKGTIPLRTNVTFHFPGIEKQEAIFDGFVPFEGLELPTSFSDTFWEKGSIVRQKKVSDMTWRVVTPSEFNERYAAIKNEVTEEAKNVVPIKVINADDLKQGVPK